MCRTTNFECVSSDSCGLSTQELLAQGQSVILEWGHWARVDEMRNDWGLADWG